MFQYISKRLLLIIPTLVGITFITFLLMKLAPGDPVKLKLMFATKGLNPDAVAAILKSETPAVLVPESFENFSKSVSKKIHGDTDVATQKTYRLLHWTGENSIFYAKWVKNIVKLDFGRSFKDRRPVMDKIIDALPVTLCINFLTIIAIYLISIPLGIWSAMRKDSTIDKIVMVKLFVLYSLPGFWVATMLLTYFAGGEYLNWFPLTGFKSEYYDQLSFFGKMGNIAWHLALPVAAETLGSFAFLTRFSRSNFLEVIGQDYVRTARAKGLAEHVVLYKHALRNALIPFVTMMGSLLPALLGGSVIVEQIFNIPGMGMLSFEAVLGRDHNVIMGIATINAFLTLVSILLSDLLYVVVDPRIRLE